MQLQKLQRAAIIDIGSNSVRLVIYDVYGSSSLPTFNEKVMAGLGQGVISTGRLSPEGAAAALRAIDRFRAILKALNLRTFVAVATAAVREAADGAAFLRDASRVLGREIRLLTGEQEASLSALGVKTTFQEPVGVIGDLGGSSLEFERLSAGAKMAESHLLGPLSLVEQKLDPASLRRHIRKQLATSQALEGARGRFFAVGGAWRSIAKISMLIDGYALQVLQGYQMNEGQVARAAKLCVDSLTLPAARARVESVDRRRARHLPIAAIILEEILGRSALDGVTISSSGLREGALRELVGPVESDPLLDGIAAFGRLDQAQIDFGTTLHAFISPAFHPEKDLFGSPAADVRIERAACLLADGAGRFHPDHRPQMAYDQVLRGPYSSVTHAERALLAHAIGCRYSRDFKRPQEYVSLTTDAQADRARQLGSAMRLGADFSGRSGPILQRAKLQRRADTLELRIAKADEALVSETVERRLEQTASLLRLKSKIVLT
jgi:exopolyphosphatase / guanosine-5'-triphosphate,3'-diphosphate pyrophosphatase